MFFTLLTLIFLVNNLKNNNNNNMKTYRKSERCSTCGGTGECQEGVYDNNNYCIGKFVKCSSCGGSGYCTYEYTLEEKDPSLYKKEMDDYRSEKESLRDNLKYHEMMLRKNNNDRSKQHEINARERCRSLEEPNRYKVTERKKIK